MLDPYAMLLWFLVALVVWFNWRAIATVLLLMLTSIALRLGLARVAAGLIHVGIWVNGGDDA